MKRLLLTATTALLLSVGAARAGPMDDGVAAYQRGDYATALQIFRSLAAQGNASAQNGLGLMYDNGQGVTQDYAEALKWYRLAAEQGNASAQSNLGAMYYEGTGVKQDYAEAGKWYRLAAAQGRAEAQHSLGTMYSFGHGVTQDDVRAHMWLNLAGASGDVGAVKDRDLVASVMTPHQIAEAQKMASECQEHKFKDCD